MSGRVYRCYDAGNVLLYVGCTSKKVSARMAQHRHYRPDWAKRVTRIEIDEYPDLKQACMVEAALIMILHPLANKVHRSDWRRRMANGEAAA